MGFSRDEVGLTGPRAAGVGRGKVSGVAAAGCALEPGQAALGFPPPPPPSFGAVPGRLPLFKDNKNKLDDRKSGVIGVIWARASSPGWRGFAC